MGKLTPVDSPLQWAGGYAFDAYCKWDNPQHSFREFPHTAEHVETLGHAMKQLRAKGWIFHDDNTGTCPRCRAALKTGEKS